MIIQLEQARAYLQSKRDEFEELALVAVYYTFWHRVFGLRGKSRLNIKILSDAPKQKLRRQVKLILADAPCLVQTEFYPASEERGVAYDGQWPENAGLAYDGCFPLIEKRTRVSMPH